MTTDANYPVFEDFNEPRDEPAEPQAEDPVPSLADSRALHDEAWTDGYLAGRQERGAQGDDQNLAAKLVASVFELDAKASEAVQAASLAVADLMVNAVMAVTSDDWPARLMDRVRNLVERIKPALTVAPEFLLRDDQGVTHSFADISELSRALEAGKTGEDVSIRWQRGEATISRTALLEDLRQAIIPLSSSLVNEQNARCPT